jgi:hypothetical protein
MKKLIIFLTILIIALVTSNRVNELRRDANLEIHNIARIHGENGVPINFVIAERREDYLEFPIYIESGRALVSAARVKRFEVGMTVKNENARITSVSNRIDLDSGMFVVRFSKNITGNFFIQKRHTGFFLPLDSVLPDGAKIIAGDWRQMVVTGIKAGDKIRVR